MQREYGKVVSGLLGSFPDILEGKTRLAQNIRLEALAKAFVAAFRDDSTIGRSLDVPDIREMWKS